MLRKIILSLAIAFPVPALAGMEAAAEYTDRARSWAWSMGNLAACGVTGAPGEVEAEAARGAEAMAPGLWRWVTGERAAKQQDLFDGMWAAHNVGKASQCQTSQPEASLSRLLMDISRDRLSD